MTDSNVQFMSSATQDMVTPNQPLHMALPFTRGQAFIVSVLDSILSLVINDVRKCLLKMIFPLSKASGFQLLTLRLLYQTLNMRFPFSNSKVTCHFIVPCPQISMLFLGAYCYLTAFNNSYAAGLHWLLN